MKYYPKLQKLIKTRSRSNQIHEHKKIKSVKCFNSIIPIFENVNKLVYRSHCLPEKITPCITGLNTSIYEIVVIYL